MFRLEALFTVCGIQYCNKLEYIFEKDQAANVDGETRYELTRDTVPFSKCGHAMQEITFCMYLRKLYVR